MKHTSKHVLTLTAMLATAGALVAAPTQSGVQPLRTGRALQSPTSQQQLVAPVPPANPIPISSLPFDINQPGYYQMTQDLVGAPGTNGIRVFANPVVIDLNGFTLNGNVSGTQSGIRCFSLGNGTTIFNGTIFGWGQEGIISPFDCNVLDVTSRFNKGNGMNLGPKSVVQDCVVTNNNDGILGPDLTVVNCTAFGNVQEGIEGTGSGLVVRNCTVDSNGGAGIVGLEPDPNEPGGNPCVIEDSRIVRNKLGGMILPGFSHVRRCLVKDNEEAGLRVGPFSHVGHCSVFRNLRGIFVGEGTTITDCEVAENQLEGISGPGGLSVQHCKVIRNKAGVVFEDPGGRIEDCTVMDNTSFGILVATNALVSNNSVLENQDQGILATGDGNRIEGNHVARNGIGIDVQGRRNLIVRNSLDTNGVQMQVAAENIQGPFLKTTGFIQSDNPWANFDLSFPVTFP